MANETAAQLLIRIAADPSQANASIQAFQANFGQTFTQLGTQLGNWSSQGTLSFTRVTSAAKTFSTNLTTHLTSARTQFESTRTSALRWGSDTKSSFEQVGQGMAGLQSTLVRGLVGFDFALASNITTALVWQKSIGQAFEQAAVRAIGALAQESIVRALYSAALGFYLLAIGDFTGAGQAFESAALFGAVGGAAAIAARALAGSASGGSGAAASGGSSSAKSSSASSRASQSNANQQTVQVIFQGPYYGGQAGLDELVRHISQAVIERDVNLVAYTTVRQPAVRE